MHNGISKCIVHVYYVHVNGISKCIVHVYYVHVHLSVHPCFIVVVVCNKAVGAKRFSEAPWSLVLIVWVVARTKVLRLVSLHQPSLALPKVPCLGQSMVDFKGIMALKGSPQVCRP